MKRILQLILLLLIVKEASAQNVTFFSSEFEEGVKRHLNLDLHSPVEQLQTDTITDIDLSGLGIKDIRDVVFMPNLKTLDMSYNEIVDVSPLLLLDSLQNVDLRNNLLEDISELSFASSSSMVVNIAYNYITDFSRFYLPSNCDLRIVGMAAQKDKNVTYMDVYELFADVENGQSVVNYRGYSNMEGEFYLNCGNTHVKAVMDGNFKTIMLSKELTSTTKAILSNGEKSSETYVVPPTKHIVEGNGEIMINTELPEGYRIGYLSALHGTVEANGPMIHYVAPSSIVADTLYMSYYEGKQIRGFAEIYFMSKDIYNGVKDVQQKSPLTMTLYDDVLRIAGLQTKNEGMTEVKVYDAMGRTMATHKFCSQQEADVQLPSKLSVVIVEVIYDGQRFVTKVAAK